ncbi:MAG: hypothetical protein E7302_11535 [Butyrivibrio sp.]|nr:hypothetical protein [Butyrivibrio sp.]
MQVNYNISAMIANNALASNDNKLAESIERLSTGLKIANAKDNPSGLAISRRMNAQIKSLNVAGNNSGDGISVIQTADGTLTEIHSILQRMNELAVQSSNGTNSGDDREIIQDEITQLKDEITRIAEATQFNGQTLLDGTFDLRGYATVNGKTDPAITVNSYSDSVFGGNYTIEGLYTKYNEVTGEVTLYESADDRDNGRNALDQGLIDVIKVNSSQGKTTTETYMSNAAVTVDGDLLKISVNDGREIELKINKNLNGEKIDLELTGKGAMTMQIGANEGQTLDIRMPKVTLSNLGIQYTDFTRTIKDDVADNLNAITTNDVYTLPDETLAQAEWDKIKRCRDDLYEFAQYTRIEIDLGTYNHVDSDIATKIQSVRQDSELTADEKEDQITAIWEERYMTIVNEIDSIENEVDDVGNPITALEKLTKFDNEYFITTKWQNDINNTLLSQDYGEIMDYQAGIKLDGILNGSKDAGINAPYTGSDQAIEDIGRAIQKVSDIRSRLGAYQNRLDHTVSNINVTTENMTAAYSRIMDVDMAEEMTVYTTQNVLSQAGTSMLAQANERPSQVLQLLQ